MPFAGLALAAASLCGDYGAGPLLRFPFFFVLPVCLLAWFGHGRLAFGTVGVLVLERFSLETWLWRSEPSLLYAVVNGAIRLVVLGLLAFFVYSAGVQVRALTRKVAILEDILPICSHCKRIRDEAGDWKPLEVYISARSSAQFSHGICPDCMEGHYGEYLGPG